MLAAEVVVRDEQRGHGGIVFRRLVFNAAYLCGAVAGFALAGLVSLDELREFHPRTKVKRGVVHK